MDFEQGFKLAFTSADGLTTLPTIIACSTLENGTAQSCALTGSTGVEILDLIIQSDVSDGSTSTVPEPASLAIFGFGFLGLGFMRRRRVTKA